MNGCNTCSFAHGFDNLCYHSKNRERSSSGLTYARRTHRLLVWSEDCRGEWWKPDAETLRKQEAVRNRTMFATSS